MKISLKILGIGLLTFQCCALICRADDSCSVEEVIAPAIDSAASDGECNADGVYLTPGVLVDRAVEICGAKSKERCKKCLKEEISRIGIVLKALIKDGHLGSDATKSFKSAMSAAKSSTCVDSTEPSPTPTPEATPGDGNGDGDSSPTPSPTPSSDDKAVARKLVEDSCPCHGSFSSHKAFVGCAGNILSHAVKDGKITRQVAEYVYLDVSSGQCGQ